MNKKNIYWGLFLLLGAAAIIIGQLGIFAEVSVLKMVFAVLLTGIAISGLVHLEFFGVLFPVSIILILFDQELNITNLTPWPILATALLGSIGLSLIFHKNKYYKWSHEEYGQEIVIDDVDTSDVSCYSHMGSTVKYVNTEEFEKGIIDCSFGAATVYFDNAKMKNDSAVLKLNCSFGGVELYLPRDWQVEQRINVFLGGVDEKSRRNQVNEGPKLIITGQVKFAGVDIYYV